MSNPTITEEIKPQPGPPPPGPGTPERAQPVQIQADPLREYLAGGSFSTALGNYYRTLPRAIDETQRVVGLDIYERMLTDPQVFSDVALLKQAVISQELDIVPPVPEDDPDYTTAEEYVQFCQRSVARLRDFRTHTLYELLDAVAFGHRLGEIVYELAESGEDSGKIVPKEIKIKPFASYSFIVDSYLNFIGVLGQVPGTWSAWSSGLLAVDAKMLEEMPNVLPPAKFIILSLLNRDSDIRGRAWIEPAYNAWFLKQQLWPEYWKYLQQFASPSIIGILAPDAQPLPMQDPDGGFPVDEGGDPMVHDPLKSLLAALMAYRNATALAVPHGTEIHTLFAYQNGEAFRFAIDLLNHEMNQGMLFQSLATMEAQFGSRAASQTHQDILELPIQYLRTCLEECLQTFFTNLIVLNYGPEAARLAPKANLGDTEEQNFFQKGGAVAKLMAADYFDPSQLRELDVILGLPRRTPEEVKAREDAKKAAAALAQVSPAQGTAGTGGGADQGAGQEPMRKAA